MQEMGKKKKYTKSELVGCCGRWWPCARSPHCFFVTNDPFVTFFRWSFYCSLVCSKTKHKQHERLFKSHQRFALFSACCLNFKISATRGRENVVAPMRINWNDAFESCFGYWPVERSFILGFVSPICLEIIASAISVLAHWMCYRGLLQLMAENL